MFDLDTIVKMNRIPSLMNRLETQDLLRQIAQRDRDLGKHLPVVPVFASDEVVYGSTEKL